MEEAPYAEDRYCFKSNLSSFLIRSNLSSLLTYIFVLIYPIQKLGACRLEKSMRDFLKAGLEEVH